MLSRKFIGQLNHLKKNSGKNNKKNQSLQLQKNMRKIRINHFTSMRSDQTEAFKIIKGFLIMDDIFFQYFSSNWKFTVKQILKTKSTNQMNFLLAE